MLKLGCFGNLFCKHKNAHPVRSYYTRVPGTFGQIKIIIWKCPDCGKEWKTCVDGG